MYIFTRNKLMYIIVSILVLILIYYCAQLLFSNTEHMKVIPPQNTYSRSACEYKMNETLSNVLSNNHIVEANNNTNVHFICSYDNINDEINNLTPKHNQKINIIDNADYISAKHYLWQRIVLSAGLDRAKILMPNTFVLSDKQDIERLKKEYDSKKLYIMKKNIQRQEGLFIIDSLDVILNKASEYSVVQELLNNPYTVNIKKDGKVIGNRKINMRFYILVVCHQDNINIYVFNDGFMYYTKANWVKDTVNHDINVTTGYIDRWIYDENPLTHTDFKNYLDDPTRALSVYEQNISNQNIKLSEIIFSRIHNLLTDVMMSSIGIICGGTKLYNNMTFQLYGADIAINDNLWPQVIEINKGPDMGAKDERDKAVKHKCITDMLKTINVINNNDNNGFIKLINKNGKHVMS